VKTGVECEFFLLTNGVETEIADRKDVAAKPCYDQVCLDEAEVMGHSFHGLHSGTLSAGHSHFLLLFLLAH